MSTSSVTPNTALGKDAFLQLMVTQMKYQDPLQPQSNSQFLAQLAQFSALEQMTNIAQTDSSVLQAVNSLQQVTQLGLLHQLIGTTVQVSDSKGNAVTGQVSAIKLVNGNPQLVVNGQAYPYTALQQME